jgi:hypothetical protein
MPLGPAHVTVAALDPSALGRFWSAVPNWFLYEDGSGTIAYVGPGGADPARPPFPASAGVTPCPNS